jgi:ribosomal protein S27AE
MKFCHKHDWQSNTFSFKEEFCPHCAEESKSRHKVVAIHCAKCGMLVGYRRYDVDILCVNCGQTLLSEKGK